MSKNKQPQVPKKNELSIVRSSAAEYLTFVAAGGNGGVEAVYADENVWLAQKMMGLLYDVETHTINYHLKKVFSDSELEEDAVIRNFRITAADSKSYNTKHYNLASIIAVLPDGQRPPLCSRLDEVRRTSHNFGYGVGDDMDDLLAEHGVDD